MLHETDGNRARRYGNETKIEHLIIFVFHLT